jgi:hypothetical protein
MHDSKNHRRHQQPLHAVGLSTTRQRARNQTGHRVQPPQARPKRWALVQVRDGSVIAAFKDESSAREAMSRVQDDDEVVVLYVNA